MKYVITTSLKRRHDLLFSTLSFLMLSFVMSSSLVHAEIIDTGTMQDLGSLKSDNTGQSEAWGTNSDGSVAIGWAHVEGGGFHAVRWKVGVDGAVEKIDLGTLKADNTGNSQSYGVNADGSIIVGRAYNDGDTNYHATYWKVGASGVAEKMDLGTLKADNTGYSAAHEVSADGSIIVGSAHNTSGLTRATYWKVDSGSVVEKKDLGTFLPSNAGESEAYSVNVDGSVIVGKAATVNAAPYHAAYWKVDSSGNVVENIDLGTLKTDNSGSSEARGINGNGSVVVGIAIDDHASYRATYWKVDSGSVVEKKDLGTLKADNTGRSEAWAASGDGSIIVGRAQYDGDTTYHASYWKVDANGDVEKVDLGTLKADNTGYSQAFGVSEDGSIIVGRAHNDDNHYRAFIFKTKMQDLENIENSIWVLARESGGAVVMHSESMVRLSERDCRVTNETPFCISMTGSGTFWNAYGEPSDRVSGTASVTMAYGVSSNWTVGGSLGATAMHSSGNTLDTDLGHGIAGFVRFNEDRETQTGWNARVAAAWGSMDATANRGIGIDNVEVGTGDMSFHSAVLTGEVNHGHRVSDWTVNLGLGLNYQNSSRDAYTETGIDFPIAFKDLDVETLYATAVVGASHGLGTALDYGVNAGVNFDLFSDEIAMKGTSEIPEFDNFNIDMTGNRLNTRPFVEAEVNWSMGDGYRLSLNTRAAAPVYGSGIDVHTALSCTFSF